MKDVREEDELPNFQTWHIIGGGPSLKQVNLRALENMTFIGDVGILSVNMAFKFVSSDATFIGDVRLAEAVQHDDDLPHMGTSFIKEPSGEKKDFKFFDFWIPDAQGKWGRTVEEGVTHGPSGLMAINLAEMLGAKTVYLWGFDLFRRDVANGKHKKTTNFHSLYPESWRPSDQVFDTWIKQFRDAQSCSLSRWICATKSRLQEEGIAE